jgi:hypothetical protein
MVRIRQAFDNGRSTPKIGRFRRVSSLAAGGGSAPIAVCGATVELRDSTLKAPLAATPADDCFDQYATRRLTIPSPHWRELATIKDTIAKVGESARN